MKKLAYALCATTALALATPATAANTLVADGITYTLTLDSLTNGGLTGNYTLGISGINTSSDTEGGRTGINAFAFTDPTGGAVSGSSTGFTFQQGGLMSTGCNTSQANFFCFANNGYVLPSGSTASIDFTLTALTAADLASWSPDFKIDWTGSQKNYDLVSLPIPVNGVPEPATWVMMLLGFAGVGMTMRRRRTGQVLAQVA